MLTIFRTVMYFNKHYILREYHHCPKITMKEKPVLQTRTNPIIKKLDDPLFHSLFTPELNILAELFRKENYELRIAGGAVRDILMGKKPIDLDFATNATPDEMKNMFNKENIRLINNRGERHGTVTSRINDKENFEITTLRMDILTDGRHAEVIFIEDWKLDAYRRDLTINSMFLDLEGNVYDYFFGYEDLQKKRVAFVGNPVIRIKEDYLRILRYFRFYGRIADQPNSHEEATITAIKENISGLGNISGERIWSEWTKIISGNHVKELTLKMLECGFAKYVGLPENPEVRNFEIVYDASKRNNISLKPISLVAIMLKNEDEVFNLHTRLKFSTRERELAYFLVRTWEKKPSEDPSKFYIRMLVHWKGDTAVGRNYICELLKCKELLNILENVEKIKIPRFPVRGDSLKSYVTRKSMISVILRKLRNIWFDKNFEPTAEELLQNVPQIVNEIKNEVYK